MSFAEKIGRMNAESDFENELKELTLPPDCHYLILGCYQCCCSLIDSESDYASGHGEDARERWIASQEAFGEKCRALYFAAQDQGIDDRYLVALSAGVPCSGRLAAQACDVLDSLLTIAGKIRPHEQVTKVASKGKVKQTARLGKPPLNKTETRRRQCIVRRYNDKNTGQSQKDFCGTQNIGLNDLKTCLTWYRSRKTRART